MQMIENQSYEPRQSPPDVYIKELIQIIAINEDEIANV